MTRLQSRTHRGGNDARSYTTYAPLDLRPGDVVDSVVIDQGLLWARTAEGLPVVLPMLESSAYGAGPASSTSGAVAFTRYSNI